MGKNNANSTCRFTRQSVQGGFLTMPIEPLDRAYRIAEKKAKKHAQHQQRCSICGAQIVGRAILVDQKRDKWACNSCNSRRL